MKDPDFDIEAFLDDIDYFINGDPNSPEPQGFLIMPPDNLESVKCAIRALSQSFISMCDDIKNAIRHIEIDSLSKLIEESKPQPFGTDPIFGIINDLFVSIKVKEDFFIHHFKIDFDFSFSYGNCWHPTHGQFCIHLWVNPSTLHSARTSLSKAACGFDILLDERYRWSVFVVPEKAKNQSC